MFSLSGVQGPLNLVDGDQSQGHGSTLCVGWLVETEGNMTHAFGEKAFVFLLRMLMAWTFLYAASHQGIPALSQRRGLAPAGGVTALAGGGS